MVPDLARSDSTRVVAVATPDAGQAERAADLLGCRSYGSVTEMCQDDQVELVYVATPHELHYVHACSALAAGKHVLIEKPMALSVADCEVIAGCARQAGRAVLVGPSFGSLPGVLLMRQIASSGRYGQPRLCTVSSYSDFVYRPRRPEELASEEAGGVILSQMSHQVDIVFTVAGLRRPRAVDLIPGDWDPLRPVTGAYLAVLRFADEFGASLTYSGYGRVGRRTSRTRGRPQGSNPDRELLRRASSEQERLMKEGRAFLADGEMLRGSHRAVDFARVVVHLDGADMVLEGGSVKLIDDTSEQTIRMDNSLRAAHHRAIQEMVGVVRRAEEAIHDGWFGTEVVRTCSAAVSSAACRNAAAVLPTPPEDAVTCGEI